MSVMTECQISFSGARSIIDKFIPSGTETVELERLSGRVAACAVQSAIDSPVSPSSLKDGYALNSADIGCAGRNKPVGLEIAGTVLAGDQSSIKLQRGQAARVMTGASIPPGADAVLASEFACENDDGSVVFALAGASPGQNIMERGGEISRGLPLVEEGDVITPAMVGLLASAGIDRLPVFRLPRVALLATGSEIRSQGATLGHGQIFQSNQYVAQAWLMRFGIKSEIFIAGDKFDLLERAVSDILPRFDVLVTSGGLMAGDRDLVIPVMERLETSYLFKRVRMGPGKGVCAGVCQGKKVFNLPGGPPSNYLAFLLLALPGILRLAGWRLPWFPVVDSRLQGEVRGRGAWTQFAFVSMAVESGMLVATPCESVSRLFKVAQADGVIEIPEAVGSLESGAMVKTHCFSWPRGLGPFGV